jgi:predicted nucleic acid-binding protein
LVLCDRNIAEMRDVLRRKAPHALADCEVFLAELAFDLLVAPECPERLISDPKDQPILNAAILSGVEIIITGDKHFISMQMERPRTITPVQYLEFVAQNRT